MLKQYFIKQGLKEVQIEEFIRKTFPEGNYSRMDLQRTPLGLKVVIYSSTPGRIIGRGGRTINEMTDSLKAKFNLENPQLDVKPVQKPDTDARIVAKQIAIALESGFNFRKIGNTMLKRIMDAGAIGAEIIISGRASGGKAMTSKFTAGYLKHAGEPSKTMVDYGYEEIYRLGKSKPGKVGIKVKIMKEFQLITGEIKSSLREIKPAPEETKTETPQEPEEKPKEEPEKPGEEATEEGGKTKEKPKAKKPPKKDSKGEAPV